MRASRYDAALVLVTAFSAIFISVEFSILIGVALSILMFVPRAALLRWTELVVSSDRVVRERLPEDRPCTAMVLYDLEGELFFGAAPELDRCFDHLKRRTEDEDIRFVVLRLKRTRNPDMVSLERFDHFLHDMEARGVTVLLCGVRPAFAKAMANLRFHDWLPADRVFPEEAEKFSATLKAVRHVYELLEDNPCDHCMQAEFAGTDQQPLYYLVGSFSRWASLLAAKRAVDIYSSTFMGYADCKRGGHLMLWKTDPTFYPSPKLAMQAPAEKLAYVAALNANGGSIRTLWLSWMWTAGRTNTVRSWAA
jgi:anti-anti-sigma regulatory factor